MLPLDTSRLEALLESAQLLQSLDLDELLRHLLRTVMGRLLVTRACVAVRAEDGDLRLALARGSRSPARGDVFDEAAAQSAGFSVCLPIGPADMPVGLLACGAPPAGRLEDETPFLHALLGMGASAIANARAHAVAERLTGELGQKVQELRTLLDVVGGFASAQEPEEVAQMLGLTLSGRWAIGRYAVAAWMSGHQAVVRRRGMRLEDGVEALEPWLQQVPEAIAVRDLPDSPLTALLREQDARLVLPIRTASVRGFAALGERAGGRDFEEGSTEFGAALAAQAAVAFENAWRVREKLARKRAEQELALAASIQKGLFPAELPPLRGVDLAAFNRPASQVGGDYYDAIFTDGAGSGNCLLCVADVSGKGLPAALLMSTIQATLRALHGRTASLVELVEETSALLFVSTPGNKYATAILARLDLLTGQLTYVNAGHARCLVVRASGEAEMLEPCGPPVGLLPGMTWEERRLTLGAGDTLALFSDGVTEAWNRAEEEFGEERIIEVLRTSRDATAAECVAILVAAIDAFAGTAAQHDDITIMVAKR